MALILNIETSTKVCSVALHQNGKLIALKEGFEENSHSETILKFIQDIFDNTNFKYKDLNAIAISKGPGSYTGLRIGVSTAKGLAYGLDIPLISVNTLESLASFGKSQQKTSSGIFIPLLDARRMEVYCSVFDEKLKALEPIEAKIIDDSSFQNYLEKGFVYFFGDGANKIKGTILHPNAVFIENCYTSSKYMGELSFKKYQHQDYEDIAYFEPYYLKEFLTKPSSKKLL